MANKIQPIFILPEDAQRTLGRDALSTNIMAAKAVSETVRTTLGPKGMDKMLVDTIGDVIITNDGVTILKEMNIEHPSAKMIVEVAKTQEDEVGDGTTTAVVLAGEFLKNAERLIEQDVHPTVIARGYRLARNKAREILTNLAQPLNENDKETLKKIASTAMTGKGAETSKDKLAALAVEAVQLIAEDGRIDTDNIKIEKKSGSSVDSSELIKGIMLDKEKLHVEMPSLVRNAKIALIEKELEIKKTEIDANIRITSPDQLQAFLYQEEKMIKDMVDKIEKSGATVVLCGKGIDDLAQHYLAKMGIYAVRRVSNDDMKKLSKATGARIVSNLNDLDASDLGFAQEVEARKIGDTDFTFIKGCKNPKAVTILIRGGSQHVIDEIERAVKDAVGDLAAAINNKKAVAGAGACEIELAKELRKFANTLSGREQLAVLAFADALEVIPKTLAENAGLDPIDIITELKAAHDKGKKWAGINVFTGKVVDAWTQGVIEPLKLKTQAMDSAGEVAELILRIDDVIAAHGTKDKTPTTGPDYGGE
ncbi:MAG: thermosome subunit beta [Candidatus Woesearchaeota archaeon]